MDAQASAPGAGTVLNALATGVGSAFAIDLTVTATVSLTDTTGVTGSIDGVEGADTHLIERCVEIVTERYGTGEGGTVRTESEIPIASGLKSSSAAANATVLATLSALGVADEVSRTKAAKIGVEAARDVGVTVTGAFDDASASMLGGVTVTDNETDTVIHSENREWDVLVWTPPEQAFSSEASVDRCRQLAPVADLLADLTLDGAFEKGMTLNGFLFCAALDFSPEPLMEALPDAAGVSLSGTGPSFTAVGTRAELKPVKERWQQRPGTTLLTTTETNGAIIHD
ncbi:shikimate kinase [Halovenus rubra]|uniref:Shikimate kinase n=2 Tax=Halovenus rubra TaxID=869890 RepID=A0ACC7DZ30_9EURY|nr:shikimate kinase [Halovenus rubra]